MTKTKQKLIAYFCACIAFVLSNLTAHADPLECQSEHHLGSYRVLDEVTDVTAQDGIAYVSVYREGMHIVDVSAPDKPVLLGSYFANFPQTTRIIGKTAFLANSGGLDIVDVSEPSNPTRIGRFMSYSFDQHVEIYGTTAYLVGDDGLRIIDISDPSEPLLVGHFATPRTARGVSVVGNTAYLIADGTEDLRIIDISDPSNPQLLSVYQTASTCYGICVVGTTAYVANSFDGLLIIDVSDPTAPTLTGTLRTPGGARDISVVGTTAYIADGFAGLQVIDLGNPTNPRPTGSFGTRRYAVDVCIDGSTAYVADFEAGMQMIDVSNPTSSALVSSYDTNGNPYQVWVANSIAYVRNSNDHRLALVDVSDPAKPRYGGNLFTDDVVRDTAWANSVLYCATDAAGLQIYDMSTYPTDIFHIGSLLTPAPALGVTVHGDRAYVLSSIALHIIDVEDPTAPRSVSMYETNDQFYDFSIIGTTAYVIQSDRMLIVDVSDSSAPALLGAYQAEDLLVHVAVSESVAVVSNRHLFTLDVVDVSNPTNPTLIHTIDQYASANEIQLRNNTVYITSSSKLTAFDLSEPSSPAFLGSHPTVDSALGFDIEGDIAYVAADRFGGLQLVDISECGNACIADLNNDGSMNALDISAFLEGYHNEDLASDLNSDGLFNFFDVSEFLTEFLAGCP
jgi:hypothetical protein